MQQRDAENKGHWPHASLHQLNERGAYMVTSGTYGKVDYFTASERKICCRKNYLNAPMNLAGHCRHGQ